LSASNQNKHNKGAFFPLLVINFVSSLGYSIVIPFLVFMVIQFGGNAFVYGIIGAVYSAFQLIGAPLLGKWSDIQGRKKILLYSAIGNVVGWGIFLIAFQVPLVEIFNLNLGAYGALVITLPLLVLFLGRAVEGLSGGNISVANAYVADITTDNERKKSYGKMAVSQNLGFVIGPALAGMLGATALGNILPVIAAMVISALAVLLIIFYLPNIKPKSYCESSDKNTVQKILGAENKECYKHKNEEKITLKKILKIRFLPFLFVLYFLIFLGFNFFYTAFPVHVVKAMNWSTSQMGIFFAGLSLGLVIVQGPVLSLLSKKFSDSILIIVGNLILGANFILLYTSDNALYYVAGGLFAIGNGLMWPSFLSLISKAASEKTQGSVQGFASSMGSLASIIGLIAGGVLYEKFGSSTFLIAGAIIYLVFFLSFRLIKVERECGFN
jgi:DHA1 family tetracycline resistance protein-like MFS transporter